MGLTKNSMSLNVLDSKLEIKKENASDLVIALAGNPNVGKSTVFNALTGMKQHTGNWPGKTVTNTQGYFKTDKNGYILVDIPGTYSLMAHSAEEEVARNFICFSKPDAVVVVCDATCLERNLNLVLQTIETGNKVIVCINLMDEAKKRHIDIDIKKLYESLGVPVVSTVGRNKKSLKALTEAFDDICAKQTSSFLNITYPTEIETAISIIEKALKSLDCKKLNKRWLSLRLLDCDTSLKNEIINYLGNDFLENEELFSAIENANAYLKNKNISKNTLYDKITSTLVATGELIAKNAVHYNNGQYSKKDKTLDKILTSKWTGYPIMIALLLLIFWLTITGANYPSTLLSDALFWIQDRLSDFFMYINAPLWLHDMLVLGVYRTVAWVVSVMLPPMAIFFPLFTLLEDSGYLPRIAYNLDKPFKKCNACGKQSLTMCMGFGCNAAGVIGCRIIDSPRERLLAILTNNFVPCNGRFPTLIAILTMFFVTSVGFKGSVIKSVLLTLVILLGVFMTFLSTRLLSKTLLKGEASAYTLEMPPYRKPQFAKVIVRSVFDRTLFVLGRAVTASVPSGLIIWIFANVEIADTSLLSHCSSFLDPFAKLMGLDGTILLAFILGIPANEIVVPIIIMAYTAQGNLTELSSLNEMKQLFVDNGWTYITAVSMLLFSLMHWPCSTTLMTIKKETNSLKWTAVAFLLPTAFGIIICMVFSFIARLF